MTQLAQVDRSLRNFPSSIPGLIVSLSHVASSPSPGESSLLAAGRCGVGFFHFTDKGFEATTGCGVENQNSTTDTWAIAVSVIRGVVFLSGTVASEEERKRANALALNVNGVKQVNNGLQVPSVNRFPSRAPTPRTITAPRSYTRTR
jgi:hypothetical protein